MIRKLILVSILLFLCSGVAMAQEEVRVGTILNKAPALRTGIAYSLADSKMNILTAVKVAEWKQFDVLAGYAGDAENTGHKAVTAISYDLGGLDQVGVDFKFSNYINLSVGVYGGFGSIDVSQLNESEFDYGLTATIVDITW